MLTTSSSTNKQQVILSFIGGNEDLIMEILPRLPAKSLIRFKCVSKLWETLISSQKLCLKHRLQRYPVPSAIFLNHRQSPSPPLDFVPLTTTEVPCLDFLKSKVEIENSCNGLLILSDFSSDEERFYICNPTTKRYKRLGFPSYALQRKYSWVPRGFFLYMAFDPSISPYYKIILAQLDNFKSGFCMDTYSSETDSWSPRRVTSKLLVSLWSRRSQGVFCNGCTYWCNIIKMKLVYYNIDSESVKHRPLHRKLSRYPEILYFGASHGHLKIVSRVDQLKSKLLVLDTPSSDADSWSTSDVDLHPIKAVSVFSFFQDEHEEDFMIILTDERLVISYNITKGTSKVICTLKPYSPLFKGTDAFDFFDSLASV